MVLLRFLFSCYCFFGFFPSRRRLFLLFFLFFLFGGKYSICLRRVEPHRLRRSEKFMLAVEEARLPLCVAVPGWVKPHRRKCKSSLLSNLFLLIFDYWFLRFARASKRGEKKFFSLPVFGFLLALFHFTGCLCFGRRRVGEIFRHFRDTFRALSEENLKLFSQKKILRNGAAEYKYYQRQQQENWTNIARHEPSQKVGLLSAGRARKRGNDAFV